VIFKNGHRIVLSSQGQQTDTISAIDGGHEYDNAYSEKKIEKFEPYTFLRLYLEQATYIAVGNTITMSTVS